MNQVDTVS